MAKPETVSVKYYIGHIPGLKRYLKSVKYLSKKGKIIDEALERTQTKRLENKRVVCFFEGTDQQGYELLHRITP